MKPNILHLALYWGFNHLLGKSSSSHLWVTHLRNTSGSWHSPDEWAGVTFLRVAQCCGQAVGSACSEAGVAATGGTLGGEQMGCGASMSRKWMCLLALSASLFSRNAMLGKVLNSVSQRGHPVRWGHQESKLGQHPASQQGSARDGTPGPP